MAAPFRTSFKPYVHSAVVSIFFHHLFACEQLVVMGHPCISWGQQHRLRQRVARITTGSPQDAAINPGSSGGPLLDSVGEVIGVNTAIYSPSGASSGVGFAIPSDVVRSSVEQIIKYGKVVRPVIGISFAPDQSVEQVNADHTVDHKLTVNSLRGVGDICLDDNDCVTFFTNTVPCGLHAEPLPCHTTPAQLGVRGVLVLSAREGGPASKAGIKGTSRDGYGRLVLGDIIVAFNGTQVKCVVDHRPLHVVDHRPLDTLTIGLCTTGFTNAQPMCVCLATPLCTGQRRICTACLTSARSASRLPSKCCATPPRKM